MGVPNPCPDLTLALPLTRCAPRPRRPPRLRARTSHLSAANACAACSASQAQPQEGGILRTPRLATPRPVVGGYLAAGSAGGCASGGPWRRKRGCWRCRSPPPSCRATCSAARPRVGHAPRPKPNPKPKAESEAEARPEPKPNPPPSANPNPDPKPSASPSPNPNQARAATATLRVAIHPAAADAAGAADAVLSAQLPFYFYVAGLAPTLDPAPPIGLDISAYLARRVGAAGDGGSAGALARNLTLRGQHLLPFPGAMAIAFGDVGVVGARFVQP